VLTISRTRKFARKVRDYKLTYVFLISMINTAMAEGADGRVAKEAIKKIVKAFKVHRCALDSDYGYLSFVHRAQYGQYSTVRRHRCSPK
jgi:hypothetical protein